ncbi:hypothetical protein K402DRAFT_396035 [Aulographum hederae CBS 113979]|uniref:Apple domain-containing protein n=1 Tax=Aulographum hederae CBS 113979 TaxID=1176131 RepID=A0A6G1GTI7_9PEZI|nr:hypothetical protein K402DRAFT_396035 [Aulographum hederae CBS 113979]
MRSALILAALAAMVAGNPLPQELDWAAIDEALADPIPTTTDSSIPTAPADALVTYDPVAEIAAVQKEISTDPISAPSPTATAAPEEKRSFLVKSLAKRDACQPEVDSFPKGPVVHSPGDDDASFLAYQPFHDAALGAVTPPGYTKSYTDLNKTSNAYGYMGWVAMASYDPLACSKLCDNNVGCASFNIHFERTPVVAPGAGCENPESTTLIKCNLWGGPVNFENAVNTGETRTNFVVVHTGSNGYVSKTIEPALGYTEPLYLEDAAINAPLNCDGTDSYMGVKIFNSGAPFDARLCAAACNSQNDYNTKQALKTKTVPRLCRFFNTYILLKNGVSVGQYCALYTHCWDESFATNKLQYRGSDRYTKVFSYAFANATDTGVHPVCPAA